VVKRDLNEIAEWKKNNIDKISNSFCAAKWKQVTIHLQNGHTHSCHHPGTHQVPIEELKNNPSALHNTNFKKELRKMMLEGKRPDECGYCWNVEDNSQSISDRTLKSAEPWSEKYIPDIVKKPWNDDVSPSYVEVSFGNVCNFKCSYCAPHISSKWMEEIQQYGPYPTTYNFNDIEWIKAKDQMPIPNNQPNPYVDAFWEWWPTIYNTVEHFRITGGEPLLNKNTFKVLDYIIENPNSELEFSINTNMCPPTEILEKFIEKIKIIVNERKVKRFKLYTSAEAHGKQAEYIRFGMDYDLWISNIEKVLTEVPGTQIGIMSTYNALSIISYKDFLKDILRLKRQYYKEEYPFSPVLLDIPYLRHPYHQNVFILTKEFESYIRDQITFMYLNLENKNWKDSLYMGFFEHEAESLRRIYELVKSYKDTDDLNTNRKDFIKFVDEHDRRRGTNFLEVFPQFTNFYNSIKQML
jgi:organic radical activating enzyme